MFKKGGGKGGDGKKGGKGGGKGKAVAAHAPKNWDAIGIGNFSGVWPRKKRTSTYSECASVVGLMRRTARNRTIL